MKNVMTESAVQQKMYVPENVVIKNVMTESAAQQKMYVPDNAVNLNVVKVFVVHREFLNAAVVNVVHIPVVMRNVANQGKTVVMMNVVWEVVVEQPMVKKPVLPDFIWVVQTVELQQE
jgi:hypothetical protein